MTAIGHNKRAAGAGTIVRIGPATQRGSEEEEEEKEGSPDSRSANAQHIGNTEGTVAKYLRAPPQRGRFTRRWDPLALLFIVPLLGTQRKKQ